MLTIFFCSSMKQYSLWNIHEKFWGNMIHRSRSDSLYTLTNLQGFAYTSSDNLLLLKSFFFGIAYEPYNFEAMTMGFSPCVQILLLYKFYGLHFAVMECYGKYA